MVDDPDYVWDEYNFEYKKKPIDYIGILKEAFREQIASLDSPTLDLFAENAEQTFNEEIIHCLLYRSDYSDFNFAADALKKDVISICREVWEEEKSKIADAFAKDYNPVDGKINQRRTPL